ncbi:alpha-mannosidase 2-like [Tubulanus polymorphus]|uniref:alpha-mannosidase 2-like n=1 Tax=Tubulanus polymorphus TaxID=672921 RepID=UPI003DA247AD
MKRFAAFLSAGMFTVVCISLYLMLETTLPNNTNTRGAPLTGEEQSEMSNIEAKILHIERVLKENHDTVNLIRDTVRDLAKGDTAKLEKLNDLFKQDVAKGLVENMSNRKEPIVPKGSDLMIPLKKSAMTYPAEVCAVGEKAPPKIEIQMQEAFDAIPFNNPDGGVWKQGYPITYQENQWTDARKLKVFIVPHSHTDPGWLKTFERYYYDQTQKIFENMLVKLKEDPRRKFIYAEMSFLSMWWSETTEIKRQTMKSLIRNGQLEIVTGGWVMTDEANSHYFAMVDQLIEGHQWLEHTVGVKPVSGWAIDPFGHSPTMAYLLKRMGMKNMLIQRTHYSVKKYLSKNKQLEFMWRQTWDHSGKTDMFCHMMPFFSYDVPHTCGPDPKICCQFDFRRLPGTSRISCPWKVPPIVTTDQNVKERARLLLDQYRKKAQLYRTDVVLAPVGDDFRYDTPMEWDRQYQNYRKIIDFVNSQKDWHAELQFGTLTDYFNAVYERTNTSPGQRPRDFPILSGDFYTYADRDDHYWSGYFTSRPFYKNLDRLMEAHLRSAEIIYSLVLGVNDKQNFPQVAAMKDLILARRSLGLFQHHDGITGTAKEHVVVDYGNKLTKSLMNMKKLISKASEFLLMNDRTKFKSQENAEFFNIDEARVSHDSLPERTVLQLTTDKSVVAFYNSLAQHREQIVRVYVSKPHFIVRDGNGSVVDSQVDPFWVNNEDMAENQYKAHFLVKVPPLGIATYTIQEVSPGENPRNYHSETTMYNSGSVLTEIYKGPFKIIKKNPVDYTLETPYLKAVFDGDRGTLKSTLSKSDNQQTTTRVEFVTYGTRLTREKSGAYLFLPQGEAKALPYNNPFTRIVRGPLIQESHIFIPHIEHINRVFNSPNADGNAVQLYNIVDIRRTTNYELAMRVHTDVKNNDGEFYTDLNGFQIIRRKTLKKLPLQANYYPMPTMAFIQDAKTRFSVLSAQSLGVASLQEGVLEVMMDRRLNQDDGRGLMQAVVDNKRTPNKFILLIERRHNKHKIPAIQPGGYASLLAHQMSLQLIHPLHVMPQRIGASTAQMAPEHRPMAAASSLPCDVHMLNLRTLRDGDHTDAPRTDAALILHRLLYDCSLPADGLKCSTYSSSVHLQKLFQNKFKHIQESSLSLMHNGTVVGGATGEVKLEPMELHAYRVKMR